MENSRVFHSKMKKPDLRQICTEHHIEDRGTIKQIKERLIDHGFVMIKNVGENDEIEVIKLLFQKKRKCSTVNIYIWTLLDRRNKVI